MNKVIVSDKLFSESPQGLPVLVTPTDLRAGQMTKILKELISKMTVGYVTWHGGKIIGVILHSQQFVEILDELEKLREQVLELEQENSGLRLNLGKEKK